MKKTIILQLFAFFLLSTTLNAQQDVTEYTERPQFFYIVGTATSMPFYVTNAGTKNQPTFSGSIYLDDIFHNGRMVIFDTI